MKKQILILLPNEYITGERKNKLDSLIQRKQNEYEFVFITPDELSAREDLLGRANAIVGNPRPEDLIKCKTLEWLQLDFAGTDRYIDICRDRENLLLTNSSGAFGKTIAQHMLAMVLSLYNNLHLYRSNQHKGIWRDEGLEKSIYNRKVLVIGTGDIGRSFAGIMAPFSPDLIGINRRGKKYNEFAINDTIENIDKYIGEADIIACCVPKNQSTNNIISDSLISKMKKSAIIINVGRGNCIDETALINALNDERISGAALDVFKTEPLEEKNDMWNVKNLIITPHISGKTYGHLEETVNNVLDICIENLYRYVEGNELVNLVDKITGYRSST